MASNPGAAASGYESYSREDVKRAFLAICDLEPTIRRRQLETLGARNQSLEREVRRLLRHDLEESIFEAETGVPTARDEWIGRTVHGYKLQERIGEGGMGIVYRAEDTRLKRRVAMKFLRTYLLRDTLQQKRFLREAQAGAALDHPSICTVYDFGSADGCPYIVTAYICGETLAEAIRLGHLSLRTAIERTIQIAEGLQAAHAKGILHRDLKPNNVLLATEADGTVQAKLIDFGLARITGATNITEAGRLIGTAMYICPEFLKGKPVDERADIWSLGVMLYEMLAGCPPFDADNRERLFYLICNKRPKPLRKVNSALPKEAERITAKAMEKDCERRYRDAGTLLKDLRKLLH